MGYWMVTPSLLALKVDMILFFDFPSSVTQLDGDEESSSSTVTQLDGKASNLSSDINCWDSPTNQSHEAIWTHTETKFIAV
jgi:hypothetical protein